MRIVVWAVLAVTLFVAGVAFGPRVIRSVDAELIAARIDKALLGESKFNTPCDANEWCWMVVDPWMVDAARAKLCAPKPGATFGNADLNHDLLCVTGETIDESAAPDKFAPVEPPNAAANPSPAGAPPN